MALAGKLLYVGYLSFLLTMVIVGLVFLTDQIGDNKNSIPNFNNTMYNFLYVGLWIVVAVTAIEFIISMLTVGYIVNYTITTTDFDTWEHPSAKVSDTTLVKRGRTRKLARQAARRRAASR